jgi:transcriptional regulator with XRE-family HTH domain
VSTDFDTYLAEAVRVARVRSGLSVSALAQSSGVSRAMIGKVEHGQAQPTAALLGRLCGPLGVTLSELVARAEHEHPRIARASEQAHWRDPDSGYQRRALSPMSGGALELVEINLPPGAEVSYPADAYAFVDHQIWIIDGTLTLVEGDVEHRLEAGDCLHLGPPAACTYSNTTARDCRYLIALAQRSARPRPRSLDGGS